jgi:hypothetical protein
MAWQPEPGDTGEGQAPRAPEPVNENEGRSARPVAPSPSPCREWPRNIEYRAGDGYRGWGEAAPFRAIRVTAAPDHVPPALLDQLGVGARLVIPVGASVQKRIAVTRTAEGVHREEIIPVQSGPVTGEAQRSP